MISAITNRGHLAFMVVHGMFGGRLFGRFLWRLLKQAASKPYLIIDGHPVHRSAVAKRFVAANETRLRLVRLGCRGTARSSTPMNCSIRASRPMAWGRAVPATATS
jgi:hypothetical protein